MKGYNKKLGFTAVLIAFLGFAINAQVADFDYFSPCEGSETKFVSTSTYPQGIDVYEWDFGDGSALAYGEEVQYEFAQDGVYFVTLILYRNSVEISRKSKNVVIYALPDVDFIPKNGCLNEPVFFENISNIADEDVYEWDWDFGDNQYGGTKDASHVYVEKGLFNVSLTVETVQGCTNSAEHSIMVYEVDAPEIQVGTDFCLGEPVEISVVPGPQVLWGMSELSLSEIDDPTVTIDDFTVGDHLISVTYFIAVTSTYPMVCPSYDETMITIHDNPVISLTSSEQTVVPGGEVTLGVTSDNNLEEIWWSPIYGMNDPANATPVVALDETTIFTVEVTDEYGCKNAGTIMVEVELRPHNVITPNGDGANDTWIASKSTLEEVVIYNRWGEKVYEAENYDNDWDGNDSEGKTLPEGAYYYVIVHQDVTYTGSISLLR